MKLYTYPLTANAIKVSLLLNELGLAPEIEQVTLYKGEQKQPEFLQLNPNGTIPVLEDKGQILWESNAILYYLAQEYESALFPQQGQPQVELIRWFSWQLGSWMAATSAFAHHRVILPKWGREPDQERLQAAEQSFRACAPILDQHLQWQDFLLGEEVTIADIAMASTLFFWREAEIPLAEFSNIHDWIIRLESYPWWIKTREQLGLK